MEIIIHRVNTLKGLNVITPEYGTEIDIRSYGSKLILNHEAFQKGECFEDYLDEYRHGTLILNIKETGIEDEVLRLVRQRSQIKNYFLLDLEFPYLYLASRKGECSMAVRFSEDESIETVKKYTDKVDWVWIDTCTRLPLNENNILVLNQFKKCLVCPGVWGRPEDISIYKKDMENFGFKIQAVMTSIVNTSHWV